MWGTKKSTRHMILIGAVLLALALAGCSKKKSKTYTVGIINSVAVLDKSLDGFKEGLTERGYIEKKNVRYIYDGPTTDMNKLPAAVQSLLETKTDLILSITTPATLAAKQATAGIGLPVVFLSVTDPVGAGIVESMLHPGSHITGIAFGIQEARRLEWLIRIAPEIKKIYVPFNPKDKAPVLAWKMVRSAASKLGVHLIPQEFYDSETLNDAVLNIPPEADAVFLLPDSLMGTRYPDMVMTATKRNLPTSGPNVVTVKDHHVLTSFGYDLHLTGKQAARLADQIFKGAEPADTPVEVAEFYLAVNLKTAKAIGLAIPDEILRQADVIIR
jgi:putative ABC transport system substrate-binding protein